MSHFTRVIRSSHPGLAWGWLLTYHGGPPPPFTSLELGACQLQNTEARGRGKLASACHGVTFHAWQFKYIHKKLSRHTQCACAFKSVGDARKEWVHLQAQLVSIWSPKAKHPFHLHLNRRQWFVPMGKEKPDALEFSKPDTILCLYERFSCSNYEHTQLGLMCWLSR